MSIAATPVLSLGRGTQISTEAAQRGGGDVMIHAGRLVFLDHGAVKTSVATGGGSGGNISIDTDLVVLNGGIIQANAGGFGNGGNVTIRTGQYIKSSDSTVEGLIAVRPQRNDTNRGAGQQCHREPGAAVGQILRCVEHPPRRLRDVRPRRENLKPGRAWTG